VWGNENNEWCRLEKILFFFLIQWPMIFIHKRVVEAYLVKGKNDRKYLFRKLSN
jgi:hypothetical protein